MSSEVVTKICSSHATVLSHGTSQRSPFESIISHPIFKFKLSRHSLTLYYNQSIYQMDTPHRGGSSADLLDNSPYGSGAPYYHQSSGHIQSPAPGKKPISKWIKLGIPLLVVVAIVGIVVGVVVGTRKNSNRSSTSSGAPGSNGGPGSASSAVSAKLSVGRFATATDSEFMVPLYPSTVSP